MITETGAAARLLLAESRRRGGEQKSEKQYQEQFVLPSAHAEPVPVGNVEAALEAADRCLYAQKRARSDGFADL